MLRPTSQRKSEPVQALSKTQCLAKSLLLPDRAVVAGCDVFTHCLITGLVARALISRQPRWLCDTLFPAGAELLAAAHDIGKASPAFQAMIYKNLKDYVRGALPALKDIDPKFAGRKQTAFHSAVSQAAVYGCGKYIPEILGRHHGFSPACVLECDAETYGGAVWQELRESLLHDLESKLDAAWPQVADEIQASVLSGLTTVADWIASGSFFDEVLPTDDFPWKGRIGQALDAAGFVIPEVRTGLSFNDIFGFSPLPAQSRLIDAATQAGTYLLEAPMGSGKTEAALYAAYKSLEKKQATGIYFALPTQLTSDKIHVRMEQFLERVLTPACPQRGALLLHSAAWLLHSELGEEGRPGCGWFNSIKRGLLAPFAVGTIDQALMAVMNIKHGFVRTFGLAGKVVILDEIHTYDSYTGTLVDSLVQALRALQCTTIVLSATLTQERSAALAGNPGGDATAYPLISAWPLGQEPLKLAAGAGEKSRVELWVTPEDDAVCEEALACAEQGQQVLWIENTVAEAQERYRQLAARACGIEPAPGTGLLHSRFLKCDRNRNEAYWVELFGKEGTNSRKLQGRILVGTQVLEQSLDIDADFLVTRICPTDMLLQRLGRLWRHRCNDAGRPAGAKCAARVLAPRLEDVLDNYRKAFGKTAYVYAPYVLYRTLEVWQELTQVSLPGQIRTLLEATYAERTESGLPAAFKEELEKEREKLKRCAYIGLATCGKTLPESKASTRYAETESCDVLLLRSVHSSPDGVTVVFLDGTRLLLPAGKDPAFRRQLAAALLMQTVSVPEKQAPLPIAVTALSWLKDYVYLGDEDENPFRVALVNEAEEILGLDTNRASGDFTLSYDNRCGYRAVKRKGNPEEEGW